MKISILLASAILILSSCKSNQKPAELKLNSQKERLSYAVGADHGHSISGAGDPNYAKYNLDNIVKGFEEGMKNENAFDEKCQAALRKMYGETGREFNVKYKDEGCECLGKLSGVVFQSAWAKKGAYTEFDNKLVIAGFKAALTNSDTVVSRQDQMELIQNFYENLNKRNGENLLNEAKKKPNTQTIDGLVLETIEEGKGKSPLEKDKVLAQYILMNAVGDTLQSSFDYEKFTGKSVEPFQLDQVIPGWKIGMQHMKEGGKYMLYIPYNLGYGTSGMFNQQRNAYDIQPYESLRFYIELKQVIK
jgi:FKBP-type peptidyl-prolyl cis-trans isomerase FkpA/FKBP-type peptidyl-prolyl cis-trans isomerase FklB